MNKENKTSEFINEAYRTGSTLKDTFLYMTNILSNKVKINPSEDNYAKLFSYYNKDVKCFNIACIQLFKCSPTNILQKCLKSGIFLNI